MINNYPLIIYKHECFQEYKDECSLVLWCWGCNWKCSWCSLKDKIYNKENIIKEDYLNLIKNTTNMETSVVFLGGEPTLYEEGLLIGCELAKKKRLKTKIFTNGSKPHVIYNLLRFNLLDAISIDYKELNDELILFKTLSENNLKKFNIDIRITMHKGLSKDDIDIMKKNIKKINSNAKIYLQRLI